MQRDLLANLTVPDGQRPRQVVFMVFQGESYGFLGSRKFVQDSEYFQCEEVRYAVARLLARLVCDVLDS